MKVVKFGSDTTWAEDNGLDEGYIDEVFEGKKE